MLPHAPRSNISNNLHPSGAILRVSDGLSLSSIRSSSLSSNIATAVLRLEGHTWVHDAHVFMTATQAIDSDLYKQVEDTSKEAFDVYFYKRFHDQNVRLRGVGLVQGASASEAQA